MIRRNDISNALPYALSWLLLAACMAAGLRWIPNEIVGGTYSNTDGEWLVWNAVSILRFADVLDPSPFNAFAGMGSMYLPNLPWVNPGALMLGLPLPTKYSYVVSYLAYMLVLGASIVVLVRALRFSWTVATVAAQLHILVFFPPFSYFFQPIEWYSAAPMYAQLSAVANFAFALFLHAGRQPDLRSGAVLAGGFAALCVVGLLSAPFSFVFFLPPYAALAVVLLLAGRPSLRELRWKAAMLIAAAVVVVGLGFPDYLRGMMETSARTPSASIVWSSILSPSAWWRLFREHSICSDPRALICRGNAVGWFQVLALTGSLALVFFATGVRRAVGVWGVLYVAGVHLHAYLFSSGWLGPLGTLSPHFVSWSSYPILAASVVMALPLAAQRMHAMWRAAGNPFASRDSTGATRRMVFLVIVAAGMWFALRVLAGEVSDPFRALAVPAVRTLLRTWWGLTMTGLLLVIAWPLVDAAARRLAPLLASTFATPVGAAADTGARRILRVLPLMLIPVMALLLLPGLKHPRAPLRQPAPGPVVEYLKTHAQLELGGSFKGYTATVWTDALNALDPNKQASAVPSHRYIGARWYFDKHYGNTFTETDLWTSAIPTFEEYGQWVSRQSQAFAVSLLADATTRSQPLESRMLRIYQPDLDLMRVLGIRFMITDALIENDPRVNLVASQSAPGALTVRLYELRGANRATYSPTRPVEGAASVDALLAQVARHAPALEREVLVTAPLEGPFLPATHSGMRLVPDGYRLTAKSAGPSLLLLPVQYSRCLKLTDHARSARSPQLVRANFIQTMVVFEAELDATMQFDFGLLGKAGCRRQDGADFSAAALAKGRQAR